MRVGTGSMEPGLNAWGQMDIVRIEITWFDAYLNMIIAILIYLCIIWMTTWETRNERETRLRNNKNITK